MKTLKDFLNERQLGPMVVKNPDEQEYVDKHVVQKHDDRNGNGDDVFKASNVKKADRKKDRHGYEPGEDEEVYEEAEQIDELSQDKLMQYRKSASNPKYGKDEKKTVNRLKGYSLAGRKVNPGLAASMGKAPRVAATEEFEQIDELSQDKLMAYRSAAKKQGSGIQDRMKVGGGDWSKDGKDTKTLKKRMSGYKMAGRKVNPGLAASMGKAPRVAANEEVEQVDELSKETKASYMKKAGAEIDKHWDNSKTDARSAYKYYGRKNTMKKIANEEAELEEKLNMDKASMGDVIKDFQDSDAPQFKGKSDKKRRAMAIAAKLTAERGSKGYTKEERLLARLENVSEGHQDTLVNIFSKLSEENQNVFLKVCETESGIDQMLDFAIQNRGK
jgi:hypothetical protein